jgi:uncharacterized Tic20 family protein
MVETGTQISEAEKPNKDACTWAMLCHIFGLGGFLIPAIGSVIGPLIVWQIKKDLHPFVDRHGKEALNFQISMLIYALATIPLFFVCIGPFLLSAVAIVDIVFLVIASIKAANGEEYRYPITIRFVS